MLLFLYIFTSVKRPPHYKGQFCMALCDRYKEVSLYEEKLFPVSHLPYYALDHCPLVIILLEMWDMLGMSDIPYVGEAVINSLRLKGDM